MPNACARLPTSGNEENFNYTFDSVGIFPRFAFRYDGDFVYCVSVCERVRVREREMKKGAVKIFECSEDS